MNIRNIQKEDLQNLRELVMACKPLDNHTLFSYWIIYQYFSQFTYILEDDNKKIGFITSVTVPIKKEPTLYIWQIGIIQEYREKNFSQELLERLITEARANGFHTFHVSIDPKNAASYRVFQSITENMGGNIKEIGDLDLKDKFMPKRTIEKIYELRFR